MMTLFLQSAVLLTLASSVVGDSCSGKKEFVVFEEKVNWFAALLNCSRQGMTLATVMNEKEQKELAELLDKTNFSCKIFWLRGSDLHKEGEFIWFSTGEPMEYTNFLKGEPNNVPQADGTGEDCLDIIRCSKFTDYEWNDGPCEQKNPYVCEHYVDHLLIKHP